MCFETEKRFYTFEVCNDDIDRFIKSLDPNKAHGHDGISICMLTLCATSISKPLQILYKNCLDKESFPQTWKKANIVSIYKKGDEKLKKMYQSVSLLPISGNIFETIIFNSLFKHLDDNNLLNSNQSGFHPGDLVYTSC